MHQGIFVDIFPYDFAPAIENAVIANLKYAIFATLLMKCNFEPWNGTVNCQEIKRSFNKYKLLAKIMPKSFYVRLFELLAQYYGNTEEYYMITDGSSNIKFKVKRNIVEDLVLKDFEGIEFKIPRNYEEYLTNGYGDYMKLPDISERNDLHQILDKRVFDDELDRVIHENCRN